MEPDRGDRNSLAAEEPSEPQQNLTSPDIAAKADDLEEIKKAVEDAASVSGGLWLSYLFVLSYIAIAAGAVTHEDLLLVRAVKLPFLNVELPLKAFFALAPYVVLITHVYALMHFIMLGKKASRFHNELRRQFPDDGNPKAAPNGVQREIRDKLRRLLPSNIFVQILAGPPELRAGIFGWMLKLIALTTLVVFPILLLLLLQIQFLPFHDVTITWAQRAALFLDIVILWLLRPPILADLRAESFGRGWRVSQVLRGIALGFAGVISIAATWFSIVVATIPSEWQETALAALDRPRWRIAYVEDDEEKTKLVSTRDILFAGDVDRTTRRRKSLFSNTLVLPGFNLYEALKIDDPKKLAWREHLFDLRGRHLEHAVLDGADLTKIDLTGAQLQGASLVAARLQGASLIRTQLQGGSLDQVELQGASLDQAELQGASLKEAQLQGASLEKAQLQGTSLDQAQLQGASLDQAQLQGASLDYAELQGASLWWAKLQGASLWYAELQGVSLEGAHLQGAVLEWARLQGAVLDGVTVNATDFAGAMLWRTKLAWSEKDPPGLGAIRFDRANWKSEWRPKNKLLPFYLLNNFSDALKYKPWGANAYAELRDLMMSSVPAGKMREAALTRIERLDCASKDKSLASCDPAQPPQKKLARANVDYATYAKALATELWALVCVEDVNAVYILRGMIQSKLLRVTGPKDLEIVNFITSKHCPVSAWLTDDDKAKLLAIKQDLEAAYAPPISKQEQ